MNVDQQQHQQPRKYFSLIEKVGSWHKYQFIIFIIMTLINISQASIMFLIPYLLYQPTYTCPNLTGQKCTSFVCRLSDTDRAVYLTTTPPFYSLADQLGNFRCERSPQLTTIQSVAFLGAVIGMVIFTMFTQKFGRKNSLLLCMFITLIGLLLIFFTSNILILTIGIFITLAGIENAYQYTYCYASEVISEDHRILFINLLTAAYGVGIMMNSFSFYWIKNWKLVMLYFYIIPTVVVIVMIIYYIQKTPIDLLATEDTKQIVNVLNKIAIMNEVQTTNIKEQQIQNLKEEYQLQSKGNYFSALDLCKFKSLRDIGIPLILINFLSNYLFFAPSFIDKTKDVNLFMDNIISGISYIVSSIFSQIALKMFQRKKACYLLTMLTSIFAGLMMLQFIQKNAVLKPITYFLFRLIVSIYLNVAYILNFQSFPTQIRMSAANISYIFGQVAGIVQPWVIGITQKNNIPVNFTFIILGIVSFIVTYWAKQTFGNPPPQVIEELKHIQPHQKINNQEPHTIKDNSPTNKIQVN